MDRDNETKETTEQQPTEQQQTTEPHGEESATDWKAEARKWEKLAKANKDAAQKYDELQKAQMSDKERADKAEAELKRYKQLEEKREWVREVSKKTGVPSEVLDAMQADTKQELEARADSIKDFFKKSTAPVVKSDGTQPAQPHAGQTGNDWIRSSIQR